MKVSKHFCLLALVPAMLSCSREGDLLQRGKETAGGQLATTTLAGSHVITNGMTLTDINSVIAGASAGDTVLVEAGTYHITGKVNLKPGITLLGQGGPIFDATLKADSTPATQLLTISYKGEINNCLVKRITFHNIRIAIDSASKPIIQFCVFDKGIRKAGTDKLFYADAYVSIGATDSAVIDNCEMYRTAGNSGRGIWATKSSNNTRIINNKIGDGGSRGYFVTGINDSQTTNTVIQANFIKRTTALNTVSAETDHGIYSHSFSNTLIKYNTISGWPADASGGAIKARNGELLTIYGNYLYNSGILLYEYDLPTYPYLRNVEVSYNHILDIDGVTATTPIDDIYHGIGYWRNNAAGTESAIRIAYNDMPEGTIRANTTYLDVVNFNATNTVTGKAGGVYNNDAALINLKAGINASGNY